MLAKRKSAEELEAQKRGYMLEELQAAVAIHELGGLPKREAARKYGVEWFLY